MPASASGFEESNLEYVSNSDSSRRRSAVAWVSWLFSAPSESRKELPPSAPSSPGTGCAWRNSWSLRADSCIRALRRTSSRASPSPAWRVIVCWRSVVHFSYSVTSDSTKRLALAGSVSSTDRSMIRVPRRRPTETRPANFRTSAWRPVPGGANEGSPARPFASMTRISSVEPLIPCSTERICSRSRVSSGATARMSSTTGAWLPT